MKQGYKTVIAGILLTSCATFGTPTTINFMDGSSKEAIYIVRNIGGNPNTDVRLSHLIEDNYSLSAKVQIWSQSVKARPGNIILYADGERILSSNPGWRFSHAVTGNSTVWNTSIVLSVGYMEQILNAESFHIRVVGSPESILGMPEGRDVSRALPAIRDFVN